MSEENLQIRNTGEEYNFSSLSLIFELTKDRIADQMSQVNTLDSKANFLLASATALVSAALVLQATLLTSQNTLQLFNCSKLTGQFLHSLSLIALLVVYFVEILAAFLAYKVRVYKQAPEPDELYKTYLFREEKNTMAEVFRAMLEVYRENGKIIRKKVFWIKVSFIIFASEATLLAVFLLTRTLC